MKDSRNRLVGLFSSGPRSGRVRDLELAFSNIGLKTVRIIPWKVSRAISEGHHTIRCDNIDLCNLDAILVIDLGSDDPATFIGRVGLLSSLADEGVMVINPIGSILAMRDKAETLRMLSKHGLRVPHTLVTESIVDASSFVQIHAPCILKPLMGHGGVGVRLIDDTFDIEHIQDLLKFYARTFRQGAFLLQEYIRSPGFDIRAFVINGRVVGTMQRVSAGGPATNMRQGGTPRPNNVDVIDIARRAAAVLGGRIVGVDIIPDSDGNLYVLEVNATPGWTGLQSVVETNIPAEIAIAIESVLQEE